jgi:hypothetical protein
MFHTQRIRHFLALPRHHVVEVGIIIALALGAGGTLAITSGLFAPASQEAVPQAITGPVTNTLPDSAFPPQAQGFLHPGGAAVVEEPVNGALSQEQANTQAIQQGAAAIMAEREARAQDLQQQAMTMMNEGNYVRAQELTKQREALLRGEQSASVASPVLTEQQARAQALRKRGDDYLHTGDYQHAQQYYMQSDALLQGETR